MSADTLSIPELDDSVGRVISEGFFPTSPAATLREAIFSEILAGVLGADPSVDSVNEFYAAVVEQAPFESEAQAEQALDVFSATYTVTGSRGARGKKAKRYAVPFHPAIAESIKPEETRNWEKWYRMLMTTDGEFNEQLHQRFVDRLDGLQASNLFEQVFVDTARELAPERDRETTLEPIRPYVDSCARTFQQDLDAWLADDYDSPSNWLQSTRDLFCFHFMTYYLQLSINLRQEFEYLANNPDETYEPGPADTHYGLWDEQATNDRQFSREWRERDGIGIERDIYDSWGRLGALGIISETAVEEQGGDTTEAYTLSEAMQLPHPTRRRCVEAIERHFPANQRRSDIDLVTAARRLTRAVRRDYEERSRSNQTPISMGINVVRQLGDGKDRKYWRTQRKIGPTLRLDRSALRFFARLFTLASDDTHYDMFMNYLEQRSVFFDAETQDYALRELEEMGMIDRQSDSGGAVYVRTI